MKINQIVREYKVTLTEEELFAILIALNKFNPYRELQNPNDTIGVHISDSKYTVLQGICNLLGYDIETILNDDSLLEKTKVYEDLAHSIMQSMYREEDIDYDIDYYDIHKETDTDKVDTEEIPDTVYIYEEVNKNGNES